MSETGSDGHRKRINAVLNSTSAKSSASHILFYLCHHSDFKTETVTRTKSQIAGDLGYNPETVRIALKFLRLEGTVKYIKNAKGGRGHAVTFKLQPATISGQGRRNPTFETKAGSVLREVASLLQSHDSLAGKELRDGKAVTFEDGVLTVEVGRFGHNYLEGSVSHLLRAAERAINGLEKIILKRREE